MSSGTLSTLLHTALAAEWEKITGAFDTFRACRTKVSDAQDKSTIMPRRFISPTTFCRDRFLFFFFNFIFEVGEMSRTHVHAHYLFVGNRWGRVWNRSPHLTKACQPTDVGVDVVFKLGGTFCPAGQPEEGSFSKATSWASEPGGSSVCLSVHPEQSKDLGQQLSGSVRDLLGWTPLSSRLWLFPHHAIYHFALARHCAYQGVLQVKVSVR